MIPLRELTVDDLKEGRVQVAHYSRSDHGLLTTATIVTEDETHKVTAEDIKRAGKQAARAVPVESTAGQSPHPAAVNADPVALALSKRAQSMLSA